MKQALQAYIDKILESEEYREYAKQRDKVKQYPELKAQIDEFRTRNYEMQTGRDMVFEKIEAFEREYEDFREQPLVDDFLRAELAFCRMMQEHNSAIMEAIDFE
ncbi:MAG: YlbF family regulator [Lachnospiraceae bacterium]|nr:YlbF family regulator [Lachnospiraceae bacterium]